MSGPPYALQRLPAIINFSGGRSSAFMLYHLLEHDDGHLVAAALARSRGLDQRLTLGAFHRSSTRRAPGNASSRAFQKPNAPSATARKECSFRPRAFRSCSRCSQLRWLSRSPSWIANSSLWPRFDQAWNSCSQTCLSRTTLFADKPTTPSPRIACSASGKGGGRNTLQVERRNQGVDVGRAPQIRR